MDVSAHNHVDQRVPSRSRANSAHLSLAPMLGTSAAAWRGSCTRLVPVESQPELVGVRVGGAMGVLACLVGFAEFPLWFVGESMPRFWDAAAFAAFAARHGTLYLTRTLMDLLIFGLL